MLAPDSYPFILLLFIAALALTFLVWMRFPSRRGNAAVSERFASSVPPILHSEISERQALWRTLSNREEQIARLAAADCTDDEIARKLNLSVRTVQNHLQHAREKLHIHSRHELKYLVQHFASQPPPTPK